MREIVVFQLTGAIKVMENDFVRRLDAAVNGASVSEEVGVPFSRLVSLVFYGTFVADAVLDALQSRLALLAIWAIISGRLAWRFTIPRSKFSR